MEKEEQGAMSRRLIQREDGFTRPLQYCLTSCARLVAVTGTRLGNTVRETGNEE